jgi:hypothetical protein
MMVLLRSVVPYRWYKVGHEGGARLAKAPQKEFRSRETFARVDGD